MGGKQKPLDALFYALVPSRPPGSQDFHYAGLATLITGLYTLTNFEGWHSCPLSIKGEHENL